MGNKFSSFFRRKKVNAVGTTDTGVLVKSVSSTTITKLTCDSASCPASLQTYALPTSGPSPNSEQDPASATQSCESLDLVSSSHVVDAGSMNNHFVDGGVQENMGKSPSLHRRMVSVEQVIKSANSEVVQVFDLEEEEVDMIEEAHETDVASMTVPGVMIVNRKGNTEIEDPVEAKPTSTNLWDIDDVSHDGGYLTSVPKLVRTGDGRSVMMADVTPDNLQSPPRGIVTEDTAGNEYDEGEDIGQPCQDLQLEIVGKPLPRALSGLQKERLRSDAILQSLKDANLISSTSSSSQGGTAWNLLEAPDKKPASFPLSPINQPMNHLSPLNFSGVKISPFYKKLPTMMSKSNPEEVGTENEHTLLQERHALKMQSAEDRRKLREERERKRLQGKDLKRKLKKDQQKADERRLRKQEQLVAKIKAAEERRCQREEQERLRLQQYSLKCKKVVERKRLLSERVGDNEAVDLGGISWDSSPRDQQKADEDLPHMQQTEPATMMGSLLAEQKAVDDLVSRYMAHTSDGAASTATAPAMAAANSTFIVEHSWKQKTRTEESMDFYTDESIETAVFDASTDMPIVI